MSRFFRSVDAASLALFRIMFGIVMVGAVARYFAYGWIDEFFRRPTIFFPYEGLSWIRPLPDTWMYAYFAALGVLAALVTVGAWTRISAALFCAGFTYVHLIDKTNYLNHYYLVSLVALLLVLVPSGQVYSIDRHRGGKVPAQVPIGAIWLLRFQIGVVYFFAGLAKANADWLLSAQPLRIWLPANAGVALLGPLLEEAWVAYAVTWSAAVFDLAVPFLLLFRKTRAWAYAAVVFFHFLTALLFPIGLFPWLMIALTPIFFDPDWPSRLARLFGGASRTRVVLRTCEPMVGWKRAVILAGVVTYALVQIAYPLRSFAREGNVLWNENGFRFAWRVMLIEKYGQVRFRLLDRETGRSTEIDPSEYLTPQQERMMSTQPDMILWFAHWLGRRWRAEGRGSVEVRVLSQVSLNGRPSRLLVDPSVDLLTVGRDQSSADWILPLDESHS